MGWIGTSGIILLVCVVVGFSIVSRRRQAATSTSFGAERFAADILENHRETYDGYGDGPVSEPSEGADGPERDATPHLNRGESGSVDRASDTQGTGFTYRWGRVALFGLAVTLLLSAAGVGLASIWTTLSGVTALFLLLGSVACLATLRLLALRDRAHRRARAAPGSGHRLGPASHPVPATRAVATPVVAGESAADSIPEEAHTPAPQRPAPAHTTLPVSHAAKALRQARTHHLPGRLAPSTHASSPETVAEAEQPASRLRMDEALPDTGWQVTEVPRPTYLDAPVAQRPLPQPVETEQPPLSQTTTLAEAAALNLDDVLKRRRA